MSVVWEIRRRFRHAWGPILGACIAGYFAYHATAGDRGVMTLLQLKQQIRQAEATLTETQAVRHVLERRVALLRPDHLDPDMIEERARLMLDLGYDNEAVIFEKSGKNAGADGE